MTMTEAGRRIAPDSVRGTLHAVSGPVVIALVAWGLTNEVQAAAIVAAVVALVDLLLAAINSETGLWASFYVALAAVSAVLVIYGVFTENAVEAFLGIIAAALGGATAARRTPKAAPGVAVSHT